MSPKPATKSRSRSTATNPASPKAGARKSASVKSVSFVSLGCPKNLVDSEKMLGLLAEDGLNVVPDGQDADAVVINTCGFLEASKDESLNEIRQASERKKNGEISRINVAGCLVQRHRAKMLEWCPDIDALIGVFDRDRIVEAVRGAGGKEARRANELKVALPVYSSIAGNATVARQERGLNERDATGQGYFESDAARLRLTPRHYAYLRVSEGCNQNCAFCTIPSIRGKMRSKPFAALLSEMRELLADGAFELNLIGQDTTSYGEDLAPGSVEHREGLAGMLRQLDGVAKENGGAWLRLMYAYPSCFTDEMIDAIASLPHILKYIDMPLQHINDRVLDRMRRRTSRKLIEKLLGKLRDKMSGTPTPMTIRTTFITGFPGETDAQHRELVKFVREFGFDAMGVFAYSPEPGTPAGTMHAKGDAVAPEVVSERLNELMLVQQEVAFARSRALADRGFELDVLIDRPTRTAGKATTGVGAGGKLYEGRGYHQSPQIDGTTFVQSRAALSPGELVRCRVTDADGYDLVARPIVELDGRRQLALPVMRR